MLMKSTTDLKRELSSSNSSRKALHVSSYLIQRSERKSQQIARKKVKIKEYQLVKQDLADLKKVCESQTSKMNQLEKSAQVLKMQTARQTQLIESYRSIQINKQKLLNRKTYSCIINNKFCSNACFV